MDGLEILSHDGVGYDRTMHYGAWRVAIANFCDGFDREKYPYLERHLLTDEAFILLAGEATLITSKAFTETPMEPCKIYNVKKGTWHALLMSRDAKVLIVENHDTCRENSEYFYFR